MIEALLTGQIRYVLHCGYVKKITVICRSTKPHREKNSWWYVQQDICTDPKQPHRVTSQRFFDVHEEAFMHQAPDGLIIRGTSEFQRKYPDHPINIVNVPL